jgi:large subunit ribosomal protein L29
VKAKDLREKSNEELNGMIEDLHKGLIKFRLNQVTGTVENQRAARSMRRDVARIKTIIRQRELAAQKSEA